MMRKVMKGCKMCGLMRLPWKDDLEKKKKNEEPNLFIFQVALWLMTGWMEVLSSPVGRRGCGDSGSARRRRMARSIGTRTD